MAVYGVVFYLQLSVLLSLATGACSLQCYCHFDPGESGIIKTCTGLGQTCNVTRPGGACIYLRSKTDLKNRRGTTVTVEYGCDYANDNCTEFENERALLQCCYTDFCNQNFFKLLKCELTENVTMTATTVAPTSPSSTHNSEYVRFVAGTTSGIVGIILMTVTFIVVAGLVALYMRHKRSASHEFLDSFGRVTMIEIGDELEVSISSGSGVGKPFLQQRTIAKEIVLQELVGAGRFGRVYRGIWRGDEYAVKTFQSSDEKSWKRETEIYKQVLLPNENILSYLAGDIISNRDETQMWLITQYHPKGSLFDFLQRCEPLSSDEAITLAVSAASGLVHLHTEIQGSQRKPAIAHRDIKSKNILVKSNGTCCIADFGMAVVQEIKDKKVNMPSNPRVGTKRYMAPEILDESLDMNHFESFMKVDMYAFALVLWEICLRWKTDGQSCSYEVPFSGLVQADPSFDEMKEVVVIKRMRPSIHNQWKSDEVLWSVSQIITECWHPNPEVRLTALRVKKNLNRAISNSNEKPFNDV